MTEITIDHTIKIIIGAVVIAVVILGVYFSFRNYIIPFFGGFNFTSGDGWEVGGNAEVCKGKNIMGDLRLIHRPIIGDRYYFFWGSGGKETPIYFEEDGYIKWDAGILKSNPSIGRVNGYKIEIFSEYSKIKENILKYDPASRIDGASIGGIEVCK